MKAELKKVEVVPPPEEVVITMTKEEARLLFEISGGMNRVDVNAHATVTRGDLVSGQKHDDANGKFFRALNSVLR